MIQINLSKEEINEIIRKNSEKIKENKGSYGIVLPYEKELGLKFGIELEKHGKFNEEAFEKYSTSQEGISKRQIEYLSGLQSKIKLSTLPKGIAYYDNKPIAIILKYFNNHKDLLELENEHGTAVISVLEKVLRSVTELMENGIYQMDIRESNFLFSTLDYKAEAIDLDGPFVSVSHNDIMKETFIYERLQKMFAFLTKQKLDKLLNKKEIDISEYQEKLKILRNLKYEIFIYESLVLYLEEIKKNHIVEKSKRLY